MSPDKARPKPAVSRKVLTYVVMTIGVVILIAALAMFSAHNPAAGKAAAAKAKQQATVAALPAGTSSTAKVAISQQVAKLSARVDKLYQAPIVARGGAGGPAPAGSARMPSTSTATFDELKQAFDQAGTKPDLPALHVHHGGAGLLSDARDAGGAVVSGGVYENYPKAQRTTNAQTATGMQPAQASTAPATYAAVTPMVAPANRILTPGTVIRAVLTDAIDTRNPGPALARVTSNVYAADAHTVLIPAGARLVGSYGSAAQPGDPRVPVTFQQIVLPDQRVITLPHMRALDTAGAAGVPGKYHSNILHALGPSLAVALLGTAIDRYGTKQHSQSGFGVQSPSVAEQMAPQVNQAILSRYQGAKPYFVVKPGTSFRIAIHQAIAIPAARAATHSSPRASAHAAGVWTAGDSH